MSTLITGANTLTPIAAVDTSSATNGVSMFTLLLDAAVTSAGNIIQFEYWISTETGLNAVPNGNGFIPLESVVSSQGIINQYTVAVPSLTNSNVNDPYYVKIRVYIGETTTTGPLVLVSEWTNTVPVYNPPEQPGTPIAYIVPGETSGYIYDDLLYVQIPYVVDQYDLSLNTFIVSYSYTDSNGTNQWIVSSPLEGTVSSTIITFDPITLGTDVAYGTPIYVAVNAVYNYTHNSNNYFNVSEISTTVEATMATPGAPTLDSIVIPTDYLVYSTGAQQVVLTWTAPNVSAIPNFEIDNYIVQVSVSGVVISETNVGTALTYTYDIPTTYTDAGTSSTELSFAILGVTPSGGSDISNTENVNTFTYATAPQNLTVAWTNSGSTSGVDMEITFNNPASNGQGIVQNLKLQVLDASNNLITTQTVTYVSGSGPYAIYLANVDSTNTGSVNVYMVTTDTNPTTTGGQYAARNGAAASTTYTSSGLPFIRNVVRTASELTFDVVTHAALVEYCVFMSLDIGAFVSDHFQTGSTSGQTTTYTNLLGDTYTVTLTTLVTGDFVYAFDFTQDWLSDAGILTTDALAIVVSNAVGIATHHVASV